MNRYHDVEIVADLCHLRIPVPVWKTPAGRRIPQLALLVVSDNEHTYRKHRSWNSMKHIRYGLIAVVMMCFLAGCRGQGDLAEIAATAGEWEKAVELYREYLNEHPRDIVALQTTSSILAYELGRFEEAAAYADTLVRVRPIDTLGVAVAVYTHTMLAQQAAARGDTARVVTELNTIADTYMSSAYWHYMNMNYHRAGWQFRQVTRLQPDRVEAYLRVAQVYYHRLMPDSAAVWYQRAIDIAPMNEDAHANLVVVLYENQGIEGAREALQNLKTVRRRLYPDSVFTDTSRHGVPPLTLDYRRWPVPEE